MSKLKFIKTASDSTEIINDAKKMGINIILPDLRYFNSAAVLVGNNILFPLSKIKYVSEAIIDELKSRCTEYDTMPSYKDWLITIFHKINIRAAKSLIYAGALDFMGVPRSKFAADLDAISGLKVDVIRYMRERDGEITDLLKDLLSQGTGKDKILKVSRSKNSVIECIDNLDFNKTEKDIPRKLSNWEREYLGRELSCIDIDKVGNFNCHELSIGHVDGNINIAGIIESFREYRSKKDGKLFGFVNIYDLSGLANNIMIPNKGFDENSKLLYTGNKVFISGKYFPKSGFMMAEKVQQI